MTIKIDKSKNGDRRVHIQARISDKSGYSEQIDVIEAHIDWSQTKLLTTALKVFHDEWHKDPDSTYPLTPTAEYVTRQMLEIVRAANEALYKANEILDKVASGVILASDVRRYKSEIEHIQGKLEIDAIDGAGAYASQVKINEDDNEWGEW